MKNISRKVSRGRGNQGLTSTLKVVVVCTLVLSSVMAAYADETHQPVALTESGVVIGSRMNGVNEFLGIPYAAPPVGSRRWRPPKPYGFFPGFFFRATQFGSACTQPGGGGSEDCLFLNVYRPAREEDDRGGSCRWPVMVWIHGGGLVLRSADAYDPTPLVKKRSRRRHD
jgi:carboxylesterase type B